MHDIPSEPLINIEARAHDEQGKRLVARADSDAVDIDKLGDSVRIDRKPRAQTPEREMLRQPWLAE
jgi:hypothetical protein